MHSEDFFSGNCSQANELAAHAKKPLDKLGGHAGQRFGAVPMHYFA